jgi:hypothetical protein
LKPPVDIAPVKSVRSKITMSFDPLEGGHQTLAITDDGTIAARIEEAFDGLAISLRSSRGIASHHARQRGSPSSI